MFIFVIFVDWPKLANEQFLFTEFLNNKTMAALDFLSKGCCCLPKLNDVELEKCERFCLYNIIVEIDTNTSIKAISKLMG